MIEKSDSGANAAGRESSSRCVKKESFDETTGILWQELDDNCDGVVDRCRVQQLNDYGEPVRTETFKDCGEAPTNCYENEYNEYGEVTAYNFDSDCDGSIDKCLTFKRNNYGHEIEIIYDKGCDGVLEKGEWHFCSTFDYDEDGLMIKQREGNCGEEPELCGDFEYNLAAGMKREKWDDECDGTVEYCWVKFSSDSPDEPDSMIDAHPNEPDSFTDKGCDGIWENCNILGDDGVIVHHFKGNEVCAKKYEELVKKNLGKRKSRR